MNRRALIIVGTIVLALASYVMFFRQSDEDAVRALLKKTADAVKVIEGENPVMRAARVRSELLDVLRADVAATIPDLGEATKGADPLIGVAISAGQLWSSAEVSLSFGPIKIDSDTAAVEVTATLSAKRHGGENERDTRKVSFRLIKRDGAFRISEITVYPRESNS